MHGGWRLTHLLATSIWNDRTIKGTFLLQAAKCDLISVVVPAYCEEDNVEPFYNALMSAIGEEDFDLELIFVDDGSTDRTYKYLCTIADKDPRVKVLRLSRNFGTHAAVTAGINCTSGDAVAMISIDLQDPPDLITQFVDKWRQGYNVVLGVREGRDDPFSKRILTGVFYWLLRKIAFPNLPKEGMDTGLFDRKVINVLIRIKEHDVIPIYAIFSLGFDSISVAYRRRKRQAGFSGWTMGKRLRMAVDLITTYSAVPIRLISLLGFLGSIISVLLGLQIIYNQLVLGLGSPGWPSIMALILFIGSVQMLMLGIIAEYLWRTNRQVKGYPRYVVVEEYNISECIEETFYH